MSRPLRIEYPGAFYHVTSRGNERGTIFQSNRDREKYLSYLESAHERYGAMIHVYCLMGNHYHLLLETPRGNLSRILQYINGAYTTYFNIKRSRSGHLFQGRFKGILVDKDEYCKELSRYIHLNPVRAGMAKAPLEYPWSSYRYFVGRGEKPKWLTTEFVLEDFGGERRRGFKKYREYVEKGAGREIENPLKRVIASTFLGGREFIESIKLDYLEKKEIDRRDLPALKKILRGPTLETIEKAVVKVVGRGFPLFKKTCIYKTSRKPQAFKPGDEWCPERSGVIRRSRGARKKPWPSGQGVSFELSAQWYESSGDRGIFWDAEECSQPTKQAVCGNDRGEFGAKKTSQ